MLNVKPLFRPCGGGIKERKVECKQIMAQEHKVERRDEVTFFSFSYFTNLPYANYFNFNHMNIIVLTIAMSKYETCTSKTM